MQKNEFRLIVLSILLFFVTIISSFAATLQFDDFSGNVLDASKWQIEHSRSPEASSVNFLDQYNLDIANKNFHNAQLQSRDAATVLSTIRSFQAGEHVELDILLNSASGNYEVKPVINDIPLDLRLGIIEHYNCGGCPTSGVIGFWNGVSEVGNDIGLWHIAIDFLENNQARIIFNSPTGTTKSFTITQINYPAKFGIETITGGNGLVHADYDNVVITSPFITQNSENFTKDIADIKAEIVRINDKISILQQNNVSANIISINQQLSNITYRLDIVESHISSQDNEINDLKQTITNLNNTLNSKQLLNNLKFAELTSRIQILEQKMNNTYSRTDIDTKLSSINNVIKSLENRIKTLEKQVKNILAMLNTRRWW